MPDLNPKQKRFVAEYLIDSNATQAAIRAGYSKKTAKQIGSKLLTNVDIQAAVNTKQAKINAKLEITAESLIRDVMEIGDEARKAESFAAALKSREMLGNTLPEGNPFEGVTNINVNDITPTSPLDDARRTAFHLEQARRLLAAGNGSPRATSSSNGNPAT